MRMLIRARFAQLVFFHCTARASHLLVRVRDGIELVGPLVIPGVTSCLVNY